MSIYKKEATLFDDEDLTKNPNFINAINSNDVSEINTTIIKIETDRQLSKEELQFNKLSQKLYNLQTTYQKTLDNEIILRNHYSEQMNETLQKILIEHAKLVKFVYNRYQELKPIKFSKKDAEWIDETILRYLSYTDSIVKNDSELSEIYNYFNDKYHSNEKIDNDDDNDDDVFMNEFAKDFFETLNMQAFGETLSDADKKYIDDYGPEKFLKYKYQNIENDMKFNGKKKTKKQLQKEAELIEKEELKNKSIKSIYINLAKLLHPDLEVDEEKKLEKQELMKKVTIAYNNNDIFTLLKLEIEWIKKEEKVLSNVPNNIIKLYNEILKEQINDIDSNIMTIINNLYQSKIIPRDMRSIVNLKYAFQFVLFKKIQNLDNLKLVQNFMESQKSVKNTFANFKEMMFALQNDSYK